MASVVWIDPDNVLDRLEENSIDTSPWIGDKLDAEILRQERTFERRTKRKFEETTEAVLINGRGTSIIVAPEFPVVSVTSITVFDEFLTADQGYEIQSYRIEESTGRIHLSGLSPMSLGIFPEGNMNIELVYTYGYSVTPTITIPDDIQDAIEMMATLAALSRSPKEWELGNLTSIKIGQYAESYGKGTSQGGPYYEYVKRFTPEIDRIINYYRKPLMGRA